MRCLFSRSAIPGRRLLRPVPHRTGEGSGHSLSPPSISRAHTNQISPAFRRIYMVELSACNALHCGARLISCLPMGGLLHHPYRLRAWRAYMRGAPFASSVVGLTQCSSYQHDSVLATHTRGRRLSLGLGEMPCRSRETRRRAHYNTKKTQLPEGVALPHKSEALTPAISIFSIIKLHVLIHRASLHSSIHSQESQKHVIGNIHR